MDSAFGTSKELFDLEIGVGLGKVLGDEVGVVKAAGTDVMADGRKGDEDDFAVCGWKGVIHDVGEGASEGTDGVVFVIVN